MDTLSHALWGGGVFGYRGKLYWSFFFGALPDLFSFGIYFLLNAFLNPSSLRLAKPELHEIPNYVFDLYDITHSLVIAFIFISIVYFWGNKGFAFAMLAWPLHIILDFPFHTADFFPTPILWPIIDVKFNGIFTPHLVGKNLSDENLAVTVAERLSFPVPSLSCSR